MRPAKTPDRITRMGMRHAKTINLISCGSGVLLRVKRLCDDVRVELKGRGEEGAGRKEERTWRETRL